MNGASRIVTKRLLKGRLGNKRTNYLNNCIIENGQNTEKSPGDLRSAQTPETSSADTDVKIL